MKKISCEPDHAKRIKNKKYLRWRRYNNSSWPIVVARQPWLPIEAATPSRYKTKRIPERTCVMKTDQQEQEQKNNKHRVSLSIAGRISGGPYVHCTRVNLSFCGKGFGSHVFNIITPLQRFVQSKVIWGKISAEPPVRRLQFWTTESTRRSQWTTGFNHSSSTNWPSTLYIVWNRIACCPHASSIARAGRRRRIGQQHATGARTRRTGRWTGCRRTRTTRRKCNFLGQYIGHIGVQFAIMFRTVHRLGKVDLHDHKVQVEKIRFPIFNSTIV